MIKSEREDGEYMVRKLIEEYEKCGLEINKEKTKYIRVGGPNRDLVTEKGTIQVCMEYDYLDVNNNKKQRSEEIHTVYKKRPITPLLIV